MLVFFMAPELKIDSVEFGYWGPSQTKTAQNSETLYFTAWLKPFPVLDAVSAGTNSP